MGKFDELLYKAKCVANAAGKKTGEMVEISKMKLQVVQFNSDIDKIYKKIGELIYAGSKNSIDVQAEVKVEMAEIDSVLEQIADLNVKISEAQSTVKCDNCGATNSTDSIFCSRCGRSLSFRETQSAKNENSNSYVKIEIEKNDDNLI